MIVIVLGSFTVGSRFRASVDEAAFRAKWGEREERDEALQQAHQLELAKARVDALASCPVAAPLPVARPVLPKRKIVTHCASAWSVVKQKEIKSCR